MIKKALLGFILILTCYVSNCQKVDEYEVYALKYLSGGKGLAKDWAVGANPLDSINGSWMFWLLKGENGKSILVDVGFLDTAKVRSKGYIRPDSLLQRLNIYPSDITDIIMTHPHNDHIGGINLFPKAKVWMQKADFHYFVGEAWQEKGYRIAFLKNDVRNIVNINLQGRLKLIEGDNIEIMPGIRVFIKSKHTFENMYLVINSNSEANRILIASDAIWFYYNLDNLLPATICYDPIAYVEALKRIKTLVPNPNLIIPGHDDIIFSKFPKVDDRIIRIGN
jgi:glyoxylase-like metal-dependent hydrolase (beta-lactamase superfamily II)